MVHTGWRRCLVAVACAAACSLVIACRSTGSCDRCGCANAMQAPMSPAVAEQVARGNATFETCCAKCHGTCGEGKVVGGPMLIGPCGLPLDPPPGRVHRNRP